MRTFVLGLFVCTMAFVGCEQKAAPVKPIDTESSATSDTTMIDNDSPSKDSASKLASVTTSNSATKKFVTLEVPTMTCVGCSETVKGVLAAQPGVDSVELVEQKSETFEPVMNIETSGDFDVAAAIAALDEAKYGDASVKQVN